jgi:hypothetical protein
MSTLNEKTVLEASRYAADLASRVDTVGIVGHGVAILRREGSVVQVEPFANLITDAGDEYYARMVIAGISPANAAVPTKATGMKLGTGTNTPDKSTTLFASLQTYISGSNNLFDASYPQAAEVGTDVGWNAVYKTSWPAGDTTNSAITEAALVNDAATNATSSVANTYTRTKFSSAINKTSVDTLEIIWNHKFLGA